MVYRYAITPVALVLWSFLPQTCQASPSAIVIPPSEYFEGNDGPWSSFFLRVGTPEQDVRVLVSTAAPETLVVLSTLGCSDAVMEDVPADCAVSRGQMFTPNSSSTWYEQGDYAINGDGVGLEANLGYYQAAEFGLDTLGVGLVNGSTGVTLDNQTIGSIATASPFYLGIFGLSPQPFNFTTLGNYSSPSYLTTLKDQNVIPSLSWSYTAGAMYQLKEVYGQLIFSGYDTSRFTENSVTFTMADDITRDLVVALQTITYVGTEQTTLLSDPINIMIDSTDPNIWLPDSAVNAFESAFGLEIDNTTGLYLINDTHRESLRTTDAHVSFRLSDVLEGGATVSIDLPFDAFDLQAEYPLVENTTYYFPLKRASDSTQYTLGRTFLQEAYLSVDYERRTFNVSQCTWVQGAEENIVTITSKDADSSSDSESSSGSSSSTGSSSSSSSLSSGAIAGIVIGAVAAIGLVALAVFLILRSRRKSMEKDVPTTVDKPDPPTGGSEGVDLKAVEVVDPSFMHTMHGELPGDILHPCQLYEDPVEKKDAAVGIYGGEPKVPGETPNTYELVGSTGWRSELDAESTITMASRDDRSRDASLAAPSPETPYQTL